MPLILNRAAIAALLKFPDSSTIHADPEEAMKA